VNGSESFCARSIKPFGGSRRCLRRTRALWEFNDGKERRKGVPGLSRAAQPMVLCAGERIAAETWSEKKSGEKRSVRQQDEEMHGAPKHAEFPNWRKRFHAAAVIIGTCAVKLVYFAASAKTS